MLASACTREAPHRADRGGANDLRPASTAAAPETGAREAFERYLAASVERVPKDTAKFSGLISYDDECWEPSDEIHSRWLADYRIVSVQEHGDSATATAEALTVADQVPDTWTQYGSRVTLRVRRYTVAYTLVRDAKDRRWKICGLGNGEWDFGSYGLPTNVRYEPAGTTQEQLYAIIDSLRSGGTFRR